MFNGIGIGVLVRTTLGGGTGGGVNDILLETSDHFLLESGATDVLILE